MVFWRDVEGGNVWSGACVVCEGDSDSESEDAEDAGDLLLCCFCSYAVHRDCLGVSKKNMREVGEHPSVPGEWMCGCCWKERDNAASLKK